MRVHVVSFSPAQGGERAEGGFDWFFQRDLAVSHLLRHPLAQEDGYNFTLCRVEVPEEVVEGELEDLVERITAYIDSNLHLVEPSLS